MTVGRFVQRLLVGEHRCRVIVEVTDLGVDGWRRLTADPELCWRRVTVSRQAGTPSGLPSLTRRRRTRTKVEPLLKADAPVPALLEASGLASGTAGVAKQRLAARALVALRAAGVHGEVVGSARAEPVTEPSVGEDAVWPVADGVLIFGPAEQDELDRRFALAASAWSLDGNRVRAPQFPEPGQRRRRLLVDVAAGLCVLPLLLMAVPTVGPWLNGRAWSLWLAIAAISALLPIIAAQALSTRWPLLARVRGKALTAAGVLLVLLVPARLLVAMELPPAFVVTGAALVVAAGVPSALRLLPLARPAALLFAGTGAVLALVSAPVGELLDGVYLGRLGLRATDVTETFAQRWWSGAFFGITGLAGLALAATVWGVIYQLDAVGRRQATPPVPMLAVCGLVYLAALLALAAAEAGEQARVRADGLPGGWGGIRPTWVCWSAPVPAQVPFAGMRLPPTATAVAWLGGAGSRYALWSRESGGATVSDQVQLRVRDTPGGC